MNITPELVREAVAKNNIPLIQRSWINQEGDVTTCACALSQVAIAKVGMEHYLELSASQTSTTQIIGTMLDLPRSYIEGFVQAFDGGDAKNHYHGLSDSEDYAKYISGYKDGEQVRKELL